MLARQVFPDYSVKQAFRELNIERSNDTVISSIQERLLTRCIVDLMKSAMVQCINGKRKYISAADINGALNVCRIPRSTVVSKDRGYLLDTRHLGTLLTQHLDMLGQLLDRFNADFETSLKFSQETLVVVQEAIEQLVRGFMVYYAHEGRATCVYDDRLFDCCLANIFGEPHSGMN